MEEDGKENEEYEEDGKENEDDDKENEEETDKINDPIKIPIKKHGKKIQIKKPNFTTPDRAPVLGKKNTMSLEKKTNIGPGLIEKIKAKSFKNFKNFLHLKHILKYISQTYDERIIQTKENKSTREEQLSAFIYRNMQNTFGVRKIAEKKFIILILSLKKYSHVSRVHIFSRFLNIANNHSGYSTDELNIYTEALDFFQSNTIGTNIPSQEFDANHYIPFLRCLEYVKVFFEAKTTFEEYIEIKKEFDWLKENDPKNFNKYGIMNVDDAIVRIINKNKILRLKKQDHLINLFNSVDFNNKSMCDLNGFLLLWRNIEPETFDIENTTKIFTDSIDIRKDGRVGISYEKFVRTTDENQLFNIEQQLKFLKLSSKEELNKKTEELKGCWSMEALSFKLIIKDLENLNDNEKESWINILEKITEKMKENDDYKSLLLSYKLIENEIKFTKKVNTG